MIRRQVLTHQDYYCHFRCANNGQITPRKIRTYRASGVFQPTILYKPPEPEPVSDFTTYLNKTESSWIGKKLIEWSGESIESYRRNLQSNDNEISEYTIAKYARPYEYRIIRIDDNGKVLSKVQIDFIPHRLNLYVNSDNIIKKILYH